MERTRIAQLFADAESLGGTTVTVAGWVRSVRDMMCDVAGEKLKVSQPRKKDFLKALGDYIGGGLDV